MQVVENYMEAFALSLSNTFLNGPKPELKTLVYSILISYREYVLHRVYDSFLNIIPDILSIIPHC